MSKEQFMHSYNTLTMADAAFRKARSHDEKLQVQYTAMIACYKAAYQHYTSVVKLSTTPNNHERAAIAKNKQLTIQQRLLQFNIDVTAPDAPTTADTIIEYNA